MPDIPWFSVDEEILRLREIAIPEQVHCVKLYPPQWEGPEDMPFVNPMRCKLGRGIPAHMKSFVVLCLVPDCRAGDAAAQLNELNAVGLIGPKVTGQRAVVNRERRADCRCHNGQHRLNNV